MRFLQFFIVILLFLATRVCGALPLKAIEAFRQRAVLYTAVIRDIGDVETDLRAIHLDGELRNEPNGDRRAAAKLGMDDGQFRVRLAEVERIASNILNNFDEIRSPESFTNPKLLQKLVSRSLSPEAPVSYHSIGSYPPI